MGGPKHIPAQGKEKYSGSGKNIVACTVVHLREVRKSLWAQDRLDDELGIFGNI